MRGERYGRLAALLGEVLVGPPGQVSVVTRIGATRLVEALTGELLPRIC